MDDKFKKLIEKSVEDYLEKNDYSLQSFVDAIYVLGTDLEKTIVHSAILTGSDFEGIVFHINDFYNTTKQRCIGLYKQVINGRNGNEQNKREQK